MNGTPVDRIKKLTRRKRCEHIHVSGRRCGELAGRDRHRCGLHPDKTTVSDNGAIFAVCATCSDMMQAFKPLRGW